MTSIILTYVDCVGCHDISHQAKKDNFYCYVFSRLVAALDTSLRPSFGKHNECRRQTESCRLPKMEAAPAMCSSLPFGAKMSILRCEDTQVLLPNSYIFMPVLLREIV